MDVYLFSAVHAFIARTVTTLLYVYRICLAGGPMQRRGLLSLSLLCSVPRESCLNGRSVTESHLHIILHYTVSGIPVTGVELDVNWSCSSGLSYSSESFLKPES